MNSRAVVRRPSSVLHGLYDIFFLSAFVFPWCSPYGHAFTCSYTIEARDVDQASACSSLISSLRLSESHLHFISKWGHSLRLGLQYMDFSVP